MAVRRLLLLPYAGGGPAVFRRWAKAIDPATEAYALLLPGRESLISERPFESAADAVAAADAALESVPTSPTAIYGHSLGAVLALDLARRIRDAGERPIMALHCAARPWPGARTEVAGLDTKSLDDNALITFMQSRYGAAHPSLSDPQIREVVLPALRADLNLLASYAYRPEPRLGCPVHIYAGTDDPATADADLDDWRQETEAGFAVHRMAGGHFFLEDRAADIVARIENAFDA